MNDFEKINKLKNEYKNIKIPEELDILVKSTAKKKQFNGLKTTGIAAAVILCSFVSAVNINPAFANNMSQIPLINSVVKLVSIKTYTLDSTNYSANVSVPEISGLNNTESENQLNKKFIEEGQREYADFLKTIKEMDEKGGGHKSLETTYEVKGDTDSVYSIVYTKYETEASSDIQYKTYTIDKKNSAVVSLKSLFKDNSYIDVISEYIKSQMSEQMKKDDSLSYFINNTDLPSEDNFDKIKPDQTFYINNDSQLVILFNKYEVAPGYMGAPEFVIPTDTIKDILLNRGLIR